MAPIRCLLEEREVNRQGDLIGFSSEWQKLLKRSRLGTSNSSGLGSAGQADEGPRHLRWDQGEEWFICLFIHLAYGLSSVDQQYKLRFQLGE